MHRELLEETGIDAPPGVLRIWYDGDHTPETKSSPGLRNHWQIWAGRMDLRDEDIVCGEGRQIVFVAPADLARLDVAESTAHFLPRFLDSDLYRELSRAAR